EGKDASLLAIGIMVSRALEAAQLLEKRGLNVNVINVSTIKPLDRETIVRAVEQTGLIVTLEDHSVIGGLGSAVAEVLAEEDKPVIMRRLGIPDVFGESGTFEELLAKYGLTVPDIVKVVAELVQKKRDSK
ncbi:MAG: transketolase family protein, partial [Actinobacteria bacterium]|nr:transketolase family protein [Actinomycetota bacterium]